MWETIRLAKSKDIFISISFILFTLVSIIPISECLYEDQVGKFDWNQRYIGRSIDGFYDDRLIVGTEENVIAALGVENGEIGWRRVLEKGDRGSIQYIFPVIESASSNSLRVSNGQEMDKFVATVTGTSFVLVRGWNVENSNLAWEWSATFNEDTQAYWFYAQTKLYRVQQNWKAGHLEVMAYNLKTGYPNDSKPKNIPIISSQEQNCDFVQQYLVCSVNGEVTAIDLVSGTKNVVGKSTAKAEVVNGVQAMVRVDDKIFNLRTNAQVFAAKPKTVLFSTTNRNNQQSILLQLSVEQSNIIVKATDTANNEITSAIVPYPDHLDTPRVLDAICRTNKKSEFVCRIALATQNGAIVQLQAGKLKWIREESLADIAAMQMVDLPLADNEGAIEKQLKNSHGDILGNFIQRITTQVNHVRHLVQTVFDVVSTHQIPTSAELTRDAFGLHTIIVVVTSSGKLFGIDNISGKQHYVTNLPNFGAFNSDQPMQIIVQRTSKHFPHPARCVILGKHKISGNGLLYQFNPIDGSPIDGGIAELQYPIRQVSVLQPDANYVRGILLLDQSNNVHVYPESAADSAHGTYIYVADIAAGTVIGYYIELHGKTLQAIETWILNLGGLDNSQKIIKIASKNPIEHVHSQGRVLNDRSVLYKYVNPNLVAIVTQGPDNVYKYLMNVHLIDVVSGGIVTTITHRRVKEPVNIVHSENWLVYTYYNDKLRRNELTTIELYEGTTQTNSTVWSSFDAPPLPTVEQQAYIIPAQVVAMKETITEKGITNKHVLIGLSNGAVVEMPWHLLDPRRPILGYNQPREEGSIPYLPELPLSSESVINYNQSIARIKGIYTAPSGLESTCLVFAYGLDFFSVRISPSRTYDLLKDDFDYFTLTSVLLALMIATFVTKRMSVKKALKQAWK